MSVIPPVVSGLFSSQLASAAQQLQLLSAQQAPLQPFGGGLGGFCGLGMPSAAPLPNRRDDFFGQLRGIRPSNTTNVSFYDRLRHEIDSWLKL